MMKNPLRSWSVLRLCVKSPIRCERLPVFEPVPVIENQADIEYHEKNIDPLRNAA